MQETGDLECPKTCEGGFEQLMAFTLLSQINVVGRSDFILKIRKNGGLRRFFFIFNKLKVGHLN